MMNKSEFLKSLKSIRESFQENSMTVLNCPELEDDACTAIVSVICAADDAMRNFSEVLAKYLGD